MSKKEEKKRKIEWERHCFAVSLAANPKNMSKEKQIPTRILLPKRIEAPSTNLLGKIRQQILSRMGCLRLRGENETLLQLLRKDAYILSQLVDGSYRYNISPKLKTRTVRTYQQLSEKEEKGTFAVYQEKQLKYQGWWRLTLSNGALKLDVAAPDLAVYCATELSLAPMYLR